MSVWGEGVGCAGVGGADYVWGEGVGCAGGEGVGCVGGEGVIRRY